jgi:hypothetical protein
MPQAFKYQAVARDKGGQVIANEPVTLRVSIVDSAAGGGLVVYSEIHRTGTNGVGLISISIGRGIHPNGSFANINWATGDKWMQIEMSQKEGGDFMLMGMSELLTVPYALHAETSSNAGPQGVGIDTTIDNGDGTFSFYYTNGRIFRTPVLTGARGPQGNTGSQGPRGECGCDSILFKAAINDVIPPVLSIGFWNKIIYDVAEFNYGGGYNAINGTFTAPRDGVYFFTAKAETDDIPTWSSSFSTAICIHNITTGKDVDCAQGALSLTGLHLQVTSMVRLNRNDQVEVRVFNGANPNYLLTNPAYSNFSGYLIR